MAASLGLVIEEGGVCFFVNVLKEDG
jgi:hypothetical protein